MSKSYYYFAASLVSISFDQKPPMTVEEYLSLSREFLTEGDYANMEKLLVGNIDEVCGLSQVLKKWKTFELSLKNEIAAFRAKHAHKNPSDVIRGESFRDYSLQEAIHHAARKEDLLEAEKEIDGLRWAFLDDQSLGHYFDIDYLYIYGLKLKIMGRYANISSARGEEVFKIYKENAAVLAGEEESSEEKKMLHHQN